MQILFRLFFWIKFFLLFRIHIIPSRCYPHQRVLSFLFVVVVRLFSRMRCLLMNIRLRGTRPKWRIAREISIFFIFQFFVCFLSPLDKRKHNISIYYSVLILAKYISRTNKHRKIYSASTLALFVRWESCSFRWQTERTSHRKFNVLWLGIAYRLIARIASNRARNSIAKRS